MKLDYLIFKIGDNNMTKDIKLYLEKHYSDKMKSLKDISFDKANGEYLSNLTDQCIIKIIYLQMQIK